MGVPERTVVVVHGIGQQARGAPVRGWAEAFLRLLDAEDRRVEVVVPDPLDDDDGTPAVTGSRSPEEVTLVVGAPGTRADAVVHEPVVRLRLVEARWADVFTAPRPLNVLRWLLWRAPTVAVAQAVLAVRASDELERAADGAAARGTSGRAPAPGPATARAEHLARRATRLGRMIGPLLYVLGGLVLLAVAGPVLLAAVVVVLLLGLVPIPVVRRTVNSALAQVSSQVGDVSAFLTSPVDRGAMEARVDGVLRREVARVGRGQVHVVAHSQGAALVHAVLARTPRERRPARLTTVGGAHGRLHDMRVVQAATWTRIPVVICAVAWAVALPLFGRWGITGLLLGPVAITALSLVLLVVDVRRALGRAPNPSPGALDGVRWLDLWAPFDPVPNGRPVTRSGAEYAHQTVPGRMAFVLDHVAYEDDWTETVPRVLAHVTDALPSQSRLGARRGVRARRSLQDPTGIGPNWTPWSRRDWVSYACRAATLVIAGVLVLVQTASVTALGSWVRGLHPTVTAAMDGAEGWWCRWQLAFVPGGGACEPGRADVAVGAVVVVLAAVLLAEAAKGAYQAAVSAEGRTWARSLSTGHPRRWMTRRWVLVGGAIAAAWAWAAIAGVRVVVAAPWV